MDPRIYLSPPHMGGNELKFIHSSFESNWIAPMGPNVDAFERDLQDYTGAAHAAALSSGTAAIHLALILLGVKPGDFVICQSMTFSASANPILYLGANPVFIDSEADTWNMCPAMLEDALKTFTGSRKPKAILAVHLYGMPAGMDEILSLAAAFDIPVIEDSAEALGSLYNSVPAGSLGDFGILSFNGNKIITTSGGGALLSNNEEMIQRARFFATQSRDAAPHYQHSEVGYNYRMSNVLAGIGRGQMEVLDERVKRKRVINTWYRFLMKDIPGIIFHTEPSEDFYSNYWLTAITVDPEKTGGSTREDIRLALEAENIESRPLWKPLHMQPVFSDCPAFLNGVSESLFDIGLCLPSGTNMTENDIKRVTGIVLNEIKASSPLMVFVE
jgi:dTDP-4-amino-4,6-dideoxygalactose transaminase